MRFSARAVLSMQRIGLTGSPSTLTSIATSLVPRNRLEIAYSAGEL